MNQLSLPSAHPFCTHPNQFLVRPMAPPMGPPSDFVAPNVWEATVTAFWYHVLPVAALAYLFAALLAIYLAPLGLVLLLSRVYYDSKCKPEQHKWQDDCNTIKTKHLESCWDWCWTELLFHATLFFAWVILTDDQYVLGIGLTFGAILVTVLLLIAIVVTMAQLQEQERCSTSTTSRILLFPWRVLLVLLLCSIVSPWALDDVEDITTTVEPGVYFNRDNIPLRQIVDRWKETLPEYSKVATPWQWTGDARTGLPYLMNYPQASIFHRVWLPTNDDEYVALDIAFPANGHNANNPLYLILHGLNGGSEEGYVMDLAAARTEGGSTVVVMVARGLMNTPIQGWTVRVLPSH